MKFLTYVDNITCSSCHLKQMVSLASRQWKSFYDVFAFSSHLVYVVSVQYSSSYSHIMVLLGGHILISNSHFFKDFTETDCYV